MDATNFRYTGTKTRQIFFRKLTLAKICRELDKLLVFNQYVCSTYTSHSDQWRCLQVNKTMRTENCDACSKVECKQDNPVVIQLILYMLTKTIVYVTKQWASEEHPSTCFLMAKFPKNTWRDIGTRKNFNLIRSFCEAFRSCISIIPWWLFRLL